MTLDLSVVKRIAVQCGMNAPDFKTSNTYMALPDELLAFAQAIYAIGAAEQKEKDAKICEPANMGDPRDWTEYARTKAKCAEAIRSQK